MKKVCHTKRVENKASKIRFFGAFTHSVVLYTKTTFKRVLGLFLSHCRRVISDTVV